MDEKTAKIPSLKEFKESQKDKKAQTMRSSSMQTKKQLQKSMEKSKEESKHKSESSGNNSPKKSSGITSQRASRASDTPQKPPRKKVPSSDRTYVRDRINREKSTERKSASDSQSLYKYRSQGEVRKKPEPAVKEISEPVKKSAKPVSHKARKFRSFVVYLAIVLVVLIVGLILSLTVLFKTENIEVSGNAMYSDEEIITLSGIDIGDNIFLAGKKRAEENIEKACPYIADAHVYFKLPDKIMIDITMAEPSYYIESLGGFYVVNEQGKVLEVTATDDEVDVPVVEGASVRGKAPGETIEYSSSVVSTAIGEIFAAFEEYNCEKITAVNVQQGSGSTVKFRYVYDDRIVVYLGLADNLNYKIQSATAIIKEKIDVNNSTIAGELDVSTAFENNKCYFNEYTLLAPNVAPTVSTEETTAPEVY